MDEEKILFLLEKISDNMGNLNEAIIDLKSEVYTVKEEMADLKTEVYTAREAITDLKSEIYTAKEEIKKLGTKIDSEITDKIRALFDDRQVMHEKIDKINEKIDRIQIDVNNMTIKTLYHDNKIVELSKKLGNR
ncbi:hypothetical protein V6B95_03645 [Thermoanaerobacterium saccharolyticum]|uniref:Chromosome segregation ATPase n=1 Tax=Thermoanaerobacterium butyriciformans TaxID=1702242 RepID=A0ABS4NDW3_9THEO|nr:hypothetical protein [Thermoanaerobacterium butyriciformans]MBP2071374.1 chromosome segregation ATPase [Thermoanaerobacterium butyriciformans]